MEEEGDTCAICLDTIKSHDKIEILGCNHFFHSACLQGWICASRKGNVYNCPYCREEQLLPKPAAPPPKKNQGPDILVVIVYYATFNNTYWLVAADTTTYLPHNAPLIYRSHNSTSLTGI